MKDRLPARRSVPLARAGAPAGPDAWIVSDWPAGQSARLHWAPSHVRHHLEGGIDLVLGPAPPGAPRPWHGGELQTSVSAEVGLWWWRARAPRMASGAVFGLFAYRADHFTQPWIELDFEFVGAETREVRLNVHMEGRRGRRITLEEAAGGPVIVPLGFDAAEAPHLYEIDLSAHQAVFRIDARVVGRVTPADLAIRAWTRGPMRGYTNLWAVDETLEPWAGRWADPGRLLRARIEGLGLRPAV